MQNSKHNSDLLNRCDLAACYRLCHYYGFTDRINTHISSRATDNSCEFYLNPVGLLFDEVKASNLVRLTLTGEKVDIDNSFNFNEAGYMIHSAVLSNRSDINCVIHHIRLHQWLLVLLMRG